MAVISKDLGAVTAYAAAVNRGYTGTKEEFETLMASYATVAQQAAESATNAGQSAQSASQSASDAETAKGTAQQAATDAQAAQASAQESAQSAQQSAQSASQSAQNAESAKETAVDAVDGFAAGAQQALDSVNSAGINWKSLAERQAENSEAWALGTRDGEDVGSSDPAYHNNAKWYAESVSASAQTASEAAQTATQKASDAQASASAAAESARTLTIDATLTQSGQAADAKATGDAIEGVKSGLNRFDYFPNLTPDDVVENYYVRGDTGQVVPSTNYVCTDFVEIPSESVGLKLTFKCYFGSTVGWAFYSSKNVNAFVEGGAEGGWTQKTITANIPTTAKYFRTTLQKNAYSSPADFGINYQMMIADCKKNIEDLVVDISSINADLTTDETAIEKNTSAVRKIPTWMNGTIDSSGNIYSRADRINTGLMEANVTSVKCINNYYGLIAYYDADKVFISMTSFAQNFAIDKESFPSGTYYIAIAIHNSTSTINPTEGTNCVILYSLDDIANGTFDRAGHGIPFVEGSKNQIARLGWSVYNANNPPEQTNQSYALAYKHGCRIMLADVRVTSDDQFVLWHDETLNNNVRHTDGTYLTDAEKLMTIAGSTLAELNAFDYGIYRGAEYAGMKIPMLDGFLKWCSLANCIPMLEIKVQLTESNCVAIANMCKQYGLGDRVIIDEYYSYLQNTVNYWKTNLPKCTLCIIAWGSVSTAKTFITNNLLNADIQVLLTISTTDQLYLISTNGNIDYEKVQEVTNLGAKLTYTEIDSVSVMSTLYNSGYINVFSYIASSYINVNAWLANELGLN